MADAVIPSQPSKRAIWILWGMTVGVMVSLSLMFRGLVPKMKESHRYLEIKYLSFLATSAMTLGPYLWVLAGVLSLEGTRRLFKHPTASALRWCYVSFLVYVVLCFVFTYNLLRQFFLNPHDH